MAAGKLTEDYMVACRCNETEGETLEIWIGRIYNKPVVEVDEDGSVWVGGPTGGQWLTQEQIDETCKRIDDGV